MPYRLALLACFLPTIHAQESKAYFDTPVVTSSIDDNPYQLGLDFDGDGDTDVAGIDKFDSGYSRSNAPETTHVLSLFRNGADGRLPMVVEIEWTDSADLLAPAFVTAGNYVGDACDEVFHTDGTQVHVFRWDAALGTLVVIGTNVNAGPALDATSADFDGDGHENPAVLLADRVQVHVPRPSGVRIVDVPIPAGHWTRLLPLDVDGDGISELLLVGPRKFALRSLTRNRHSSVRPAGAELSIEREMPAVGDIDGDGDEDAVVFGRENYQVLRNEGGVLRVESPVRGGPATGLADIDQDGDLDGVSCRAFGSSSVSPHSAPSKFELSWNDGSGRFTRAHEIEAVGSKGLAAVVDLDLDGDVELVAGRVIYYANGPIRPRSQVELVGELTDFHNVDHDLDGDIDLGFRAGASFENLGDGSLREHQPRLPELASPLAYGTGSIPGDFDGDGDGDLLVDKWSGSTYLGVFWLDNVGGGLFQELRFAFMPGTFLADINLSRSDIQVIDLDQDGRLDVLIPSDWDGQIRWNDGLAGFSATDFDTQIAAAADLDGDGLLDLVQSLNFGIKRGLGGRSFGPRLHVTGIEQVNFNAVQDRLAIADVTGDGALDIFLINLWDHDLDVLAGTPGTLAFSFVDLDWPSWSGFGSGNANRAFAEDLDLDGVPELVAHSGSGSSDAQSFVVLAREGTSWTWTQQMGRLRSLVDVDGDGDKDLVGRDLAPGRTREGPTAGARLQFGEGLAGLGALAPKLGARGPFRVGETITLQVACGRGGATATLVSGRTRVDWLQGTLPIYVDPADPDYASRVLSLDGAGGSAGTGTATLSFVVPASELGLTTCYQVFVTDPDAPGGTSASNGLALTIGAP